MAAVRRVRFAHGSEELHLRRAAKVAVPGLRLLVGALAPLGFRIPGADRFGTLFVNDDGD